MATPGWYPDPAGRPGAFRYWDGADWASDTSQQPYAAPQVSRFDEPTTPPDESDGSDASDSSPSTPSSSMPVFESYETHPPAYPPQAPAAPAAPPPAAPAYAPTHAQPSTPPPRGHESGDGTGRTLGLVLLAVLATLLLGVATFLVVRPLLDDDATASDVSAPAQVD